MDKSYLQVVYNDGDDTEPIDFAIADNVDNVAWVWGSEPWNDVQFECTHPSQCVVYEDDDVCGECALCGATCDWHWEPDGEGHKEREPHNWEVPANPQGIIGEYLKELQGDF